MDVTVLFYARPHVYLSWNGRVVVTTVEDLVPRITYEWLQVHACPQLYHDCEMDLACFQEPWLTCGMRLYELFDDGYIDILDLFTCIEDHDTLQT